MKTLHLFAGGGGGVLTDLMRGRTPAAFCEIDPDCRAVLSKRFPGTPCFGDVTTLTGADVRAACGEIDVISGGSPCQDVSVAGAGLGFAAGARSSLIWHQLRLVAELRPRVMEWENVHGAIAPKHRTQFDAFLYELAQLGYGGAWCVFSAAQVGAPHLRKRVWLIAERGLSGFVRIETGDAKINGNWPTPRAEKTSYDCPVKFLERRDSGAVSTPGLCTAAVMSELWATPRVSGRGSFEFVRADEKSRDDIETQTFMAESGSAIDFVRSLSSRQIREIIGDRRLNPRWVECLMGWPVGWSDPACEKVRVSLGSSGEHLFPARRWMAQRPHEPARITSVKARSAEAGARNASLRMLGNGWAPQQAAKAFGILEEHIGNHEIRKVAA